MSDYGQISHIIGELRRAAIDAFMANQGWFVDIEYPDRYALWGFIPSWYARPDGDGMGGGRRMVVGGDSLAPGFDNIRARIDAATARWVGLPTGSAAGTYRGNAERGAARLGVASSGGAILSDGEVAKAIDTISNTVVSNVRGSFKAPFLDKYDAQFAKIVSGLANATVVLKLSYAVECEIWPQARQNATDICESARNAFLESARQSAERAYQITLSVVTAVTAVLAAIPTAGTSTIVALASITKASAEAVDGLKSSIETPGGDYEGIMAWLEGASNDLNAAIAVQEGAIRDMVRESENLINSERGSFNLDAFALKEFPRDDMISIDRGDADTVMLNMERLLTNLEAASTTLGAAPGGGYIDRSGEVGIGATGPASNIAALHELISQCLKSTSNEYARGRALFEAVVDDFFETEAEVDAVIRALMSELANEELGS